MGFFLQGLVDPVTFENIMKDREENISTVKKWFRHFKLYLSSMKCIQTLKECLPTTNDPEPTEIK